MTYKQGMLMGAVLGLAALPAGAQQADETELFTAVLNSLNSSGAVALVTAARTGNEVTVMMAAEGLESGIDHPAHIHALADDTSRCPTLADDTSGDNLVDLQEAGQVAGAPVLPLADSVLADEDGEVAFSRTYTLDPEVAQAMQGIGRSVIIVHGLTVQGTADPTLPVACGELRPVHGQGPTDNQGDGPPLG